VLLWALLAQQMGVDWLLVMPLWVLVQQMEVGLLLVMLLWALLAQQMGVDWLLVMLLWLPGASLLALL
jgi:hypothetical protein